MTDLPNRKMDASLRDLQQAVEMALRRFAAREIRLSFDGGALRMRPWKAFAMPRLEEARERVESRLAGDRGGIGLDDLSVAIDVEMDRHIAFGQGATPLDAIASLSRL